MPPRTTVLSLTVLCSIWISGSLAEPYTVSDVNYFHKQCYHCMTVIDETNEVDTSKALASSKFCIAANRTLLRQGNQNITTCPYLCSVHFTRLGSAHDTVLSVPPGGYQYQIIRTCSLWGRADMTAGGATENCSPRISNTALQSQTVSCYCESDFCNDWTYASLKRRFMDLESGLMPALFSKENYPKPVDILEYKLEAKFMENENCFACNTQFTQTNPLKQPSGFTNPACTLNNIEDVQELHSNYSHREVCQYNADSKSMYAYRCSTELVKLADGFTFELKRGCMRTAAVKKRFNDPPNYYQWEPRILHLDAWLYTENACSKKIKEEATEIQNCLCDFHWCNEWSLDSLMTRFYEPRNILQPTVYSREPMTTVPPPTITTATISDLNEPATTTAVEMVTIAEPLTVPNLEGQPSTNESFDIGSAGNVSCADVLHIRLATPAVAYGILAVLGLAHGF